jgi:hypothetical protein
LRSFLSFLFPIPGPPSSDRFSDASRIAETAAPMAAIGADEVQIEASFCAAINTAKEQKSIPLA